MGAGFGFAFSLMASSTASFKKTIEQLKKEIADTTTEIKDAREKIANRKAPPTEASVQIRPSGSGSKLKPMFIECTSAGLVLFNGPKPVRVRRAELTTNADYLALLKKIADTKDETIIFLIRDNAVGTYNSARKVALENYARNGKLPIIGTGKLDLSIFNGSQK